MQRHLSVPGVLSTTRSNAVAEARAMQKSVMDDARREGKDPPNYALHELIGKGSFGRVYKSKQVATGKVVAVKIINVDAGDIAMRGTDTMKEFRKEVKALETLKNSKAPNINHVIDAFPYGASVWMVTDYCGGGSVSTLMRPSNGKGLKEDFIRPILREVAIAVQGVHEADLIHRDLKCANVLINENGEVQLCDFGVAGIMTSNENKRMTFIGTPNWMAPEILKSDAKGYGKAVDIWAFGAFAYEMATSLPPYARTGIPLEKLGDYLTDHLPRLEGEQYSEGLKDLVARCLVDDPARRPTISEVLNLPYLANSGRTHPTSVLQDLVRAFKKWEEMGGARKSLFMKGGAVGISPQLDEEGGDDEWNFSTTAEFDNRVNADVGEDDLMAVYGQSVATDINDSPPTANLGRSTRRRGPPGGLTKMKEPIEKLFDPNTINSYDHHVNSRYYPERSQKNSDGSSKGKHRPTSDLKLRDDSAQANVTRESVIDLGEHDEETGISTFQDLDTLKAQVADFARPARPDPAEDPARRATKDWTFPSLATPASADPESFRFPPLQPLQPPAMTPGSGNRPALRHHPTEPITLPTQASFTEGRESVLIDLDAAFGDDTHPEDIIRPSTADSSTSNDLPSARPFFWDNHTSLKAVPPRNERQPSLLLTSEDDEINTLRFEDYAHHDSSSDATHGPMNGMRAMVEASDFSASEIEHTDDNYTDEDYSSSSNNYLAVRSRSPRPNSSMGPANPARLSRPYDMPALVTPPSMAVMADSAPRDEVASELRRMINGLSLQCDAFVTVYADLPTTGSRRRSQDRNGDS